MVGIELFFLVAFYLFGAYNHFTHDFRHQRLGPVGSLLHLLVTDLDGHVEAAQVGDHADAEGAYAAVVGHDDLGHGGHADGVATQCAIHLIFGRCLEGGTLDAHVDTIDQADALLLGYLAGQFDELVVVGLVHVGEARAGGEVLAAQRVLREEVDVVGDDHQVANLEGGVHAAGGVADEERLDAQFVHHPDREGDFLHRVALVVVEAALHGHDVNSAQFAEDQHAAVSFNGGHGEVGYLAVWNLECVSYF